MILKKFYIKLSERAKKRKISILPIRLMKLVRLTINCNRERNRLPKRNYYPLYCNFLVVIIRDLYCRISRKGNYFHSIAQQPRCFMINISIARCTLLYSTKNFDLPDMIKPRLFDHLKSPDFLMWLMLEYKSHKIVAKTSLASVQRTVPGLSIKESLLNTVLLNNSLSLLFLFIPVAVYVTSPLSGVHCHVSGAFLLSVHNFLYPSCPLMFSQTCR